jgi:hypothetical protein
MLLNFSFQMGTGVSNMVNPMTGLLYKAPSLSVTKFITMVAINLATCAALLNNVIKPTPEPG